MACLARIAGNATNKNCVGHGQGRSRWTHLGLKAMKNRRRRRRPCSRSHPRRPNRPPKWNALRRSGMRHLERLAGFTGHLDGFDPASQRRPGALLSVLSRSLVPTAVTCKEINRKKTSEREEEERRCRRWVTRKKVAEVAWGWWPAVLSPVPRGFKASTPPSWEFGRAGQMGVGGGS